MGANEYFQKFQAQTKMFVIVYCCCLLLKTKPVSYPRQQELGQSMNRRKGNKKNICSKAEKSEDVKKSKNAHFLCHKYVEFFFKIHPFLRAGYGPEMLHQII